jgi:hypothetical protein
LLQQYIYECDSHVKEDTSSTLSTLQMNN